MRKNDVTQIPVLKRKIKEKELRIYELKQLATGLSAIRYDKELVQSSHAGSKVETVVSEYLELEVEVKRLKSILETEQKEFEMVYDQMESDKEKMFLRMKYVEESSNLEEVFNCSRWTIYRLNGKSLKNYRQKRQDMFGL